jgi:hypothetical protein
MVEQNIQYPTYQARVTLGASRTGRESSSGLEKHMPHVSLWDSMSPEDQAKAATLVSQNDSHYW